MGVSPLEEEWEDLAKASSIYFLLRVSAREKEKVDRLSREVVLGRGLKEVGEQDKSLEDAAGMSGAWRPGALE